MAILLLPPSEGKTPAAVGPKLKLPMLSFPELTPIREKVLASVIALSTGPQKKALTTLGISDKQICELENNQRLLTGHCAPAWQIYTGVLFGALDAQSLRPAQLTKLSQSAYVQSALFGLIGFADPIPAYRLSGDTALPKLGTLTSQWSAACGQVLAESNELIIDLRSGTYVKLGPLPQSAHAVTPKIFQKMPKGEPKVVSHHNKATKGRIVRAIAQSKKSVKTMDDLADVISSLGADVEMVTKTGKPTEMKVVVAVL